ncbi:hypothetical protein [Streptomyces sasae]|uniref:hypothetical protein n=1 Tax=Streptomyces sasae TaxID=1266772 RepID=UPI00292F37E1|nr:hypothetical protein [Streptomyces sasae]
MNPDQEREGNPAVVDDAHRLTWLYAAFMDYVQHHDEREGFTLVLAGAFAAEFSLADAGAYPPPGHRYARLDED